MHRNGFIHRDIKPENILLKSQDKLLKIGDFGTTCHVTEGQPYTEYVATRWYRSPECLLTEGWYNSKMDIWAAGCVLYEMSNGHPLFDGENQYDQIEKIDQVLGYPEYRLMSKFKKHKSDVFVKQYETKNQTTKITHGIGLHTIYQPYRPAFELLKNMIVCDPAKRNSADQLLKKSYFLEMKDTEYEYKVIKFEEALRKISKTILLTGKEKVSGSYIYTSISNINVIN